MLIETRGLEHRELNELIRRSGGAATLADCCGQRFIAAGMSGCDIDIEGVPGNALGAYFNGGTITVRGNAQDAVGDTMNAGRIVIHGSIGDAAGYGMRGGRIYVRGNAGYRAGIHMKAYGDSLPVMVIGGRAGSFLGEYQAGGIIIVLGLDSGPERIVGEFPCTGMHGGTLYLRGDCEGVRFPVQVNVRKATDEDMEALEGYLADYCEVFGLDPGRITEGGFTVVTPDSSNPYRQLYVAN
ncbi:MAG: glutamate synthase [Eubacteriaceae bacterium]|nr:glutamate synthase [Eubacteriaceae bacterium]